MTHIDDNATSADHLNRRGFAEGLSSLIVNAPDSTSFRLGIYGGWGEGKTSVLSIMQSDLVASKIVCVPLIPWTAKTSEELLEDLLLAIVDALKIPVGKKIARQELGQKRAEAMSSLVGQAKEISSFIKIGSVVIDKLVSASGSRLRGWKDNVLLDAVTEALSLQRVVVFVDDLDRVKPDLLPDLLLNLRSTLDLPNLFFVLALSPQIVQEGLSKIHPGWDDSLKFLEKIVEYPVWLPVPTESDIQHFIRQNIQVLADVLNADVLDRLSPLLPRNPRQIKLFLRFLASLQGQLRRFQSDEINLYALYLCQLMRIEFPTEVQRMSKKEKILMDIETNFYDTVEKNRSNRKPVDPMKRPEAEVAPTQEPQRERFLELCVGLREVAPIGDLYPLPMLFNLLEHPPVLTWMELQALYQEFGDADTSEKANLVRTWLGKTGTPTPDRASSLLNMAVRGRQNLLDAVASAETKAQMQSLLPDVRLTTLFLEVLIRDLGLIRDGLVLPETWLTLFVHLGRWAHWLTPRDIYQPLRNDEIRLLNLAAQKMPVQIQDTMYEHISRVADLSIRRDALFDSTSPIFKRAATEIARVTGASIAARLVSSFEQPYGIRPMWNMEPRHVYRNFLLYPSSPIFSSECRRQMTILAKRAWQDETVQKNFLDYFEMLAVGATASGHNLPYDGCSQVVKDARHIKMVWQAATARQLNIRIVGTLKARREKLIEAGVPEATLPLPRWWKRMEKDFEAKSEDD